MQSGLRVCTDREHRLNFSHASKFNRGYRHHKIHGKMKRIPGYVHLSCMGTSMRMVALVSVASTRRMAMMTMY